MLTACTAITDLRDAWDVHISGLQRYQEAALVLEEGLAIDPFHPDLKAHLEKATQGIFKDLLDGAHCTSLQAWSC